MSALIKTILLKTSEETLRFAADFAADIKAPANVYLEGQLGAGKTTFVKGFLGGLGYDGLVKSPTYTLVETYCLEGAVVLHADLYRIHDCIELENMGFRDYFSERTIGIIEWASHAAGWLPKPDWMLSFKVPQAGEGRIVEVVRV